MFYTFIGKTLTIFTSINILFTQTKFTVVTREAGACHVSKVTKCIVYTLITHSQTRLAGVHLGFTQSISGIETLTTGADGVDTGSHSNAFTRNITARFAGIY